MLPLKYTERALEILQQWVPEDEIGVEELRIMIDKAYTGFGHCGDSTSVAPVVHLEDNQYMLELFHGPTASFKDLALQLTPKLFARAAEEADGLTYLILVATSGDTGSAALHGFGGVGIPCMVLYPKTGVSSIQRAQMTSTPIESTHTIGIEGDFDWCQTAVKTLFNDVEFQAELEAEYGVNLSAANSMNWGRLLPQVVYHTSAYLDLVTSGVIEMGDPVDVCVPTGNFGNVLAAVYAKAMGIPFRNFTVAANKNNVLADLLETGVYDIKKRSLSKTISPSIDILTSSNFERMLHLLCLQAGDGDAGAEVKRCFEALKDEGRFEVSDNILRILKAEMQGGWTTEAECSATIEAVFERTGYLLDPHTAVAKHVADQKCEKDVPVLISATAHYGKFASDIVETVGAGPATAGPGEMLANLKATASRPGAHEELIKVVTETPVHKTNVGSDLGQVKAEVRLFLDRFFGR